jgi:hypothetical protein
MMMMKVQKSSKTQQHFYFIGHTALYACKIFDDIKKNGYFSQNVLRIRKNDNETTRHRNKKGENGKKIEFVCYLLGCDAM